MSKNLFQVLSVLIVFFFLSACGAPAEGDGNLIPPTVAADVVIPPTATATATVAPVVVDETAVPTVPAATPTLVLPPGGASHLVLSADYCKTSACDILYTNIIEYNLGEDVVQELWVGETHTSVNISPNGEIFAIQPIEISRVVPLYTLTRDNVQTLVHEKAFSGKWLESGELAFIALGAKGYQLFLAGSNGEDIRAVTSLSDTNVAGFSPLDSSVGYFYWAGGFNSRGPLGVQSAHFVPRDAAPVPFTAQSITSPDGSAVLSYSGGEYSLTGILSGETARVKLPEGLSIRTYNSVFPLSDEYLLSRRLPSASGLIEEPMSPVLFSPDGRIVIEYSSLPFSPLDNPLGGGKLFDAYATVQPWESGYWFDSLSPDGQHILVQRVIGYSGADGGPVITSHHFYLVNISTKDMIPLSGLSDYFAGRIHTVTGYRWVSSTAAP
jgi:hypothetical protein